MRGNNLVLLALLLSHFHHSPVQGHQAMLALRALLDIRMGLRRSPRFARVAQALPPRALARTAVRTPGVAGAGYLRGSSGDLSPLLFFDQL